MCGIRAAALRSGRGPDTPPMLCAKAVWAPYGGRGGPRGLDLGNIVDLGDIAAIRLYGAPPVQERLATKT